MKTTLQFFKDMGVCDGAYAVLERFFNAAGVVEYDYAAGYEVMLGMMGQLELEAAKSADPAHANAQAWLKWCYDLRDRPEAIQYFGDHVKENLFRTADGHLHETLAAAQDHHRRVFDKLRRDHSACRVINGVKLGVAGTETWEVIDPRSVDPAGYDAFVWHEAETGVNHRASGIEEAIAFDAAQSAVLVQINAAETAARIERKVSDESGAFEVWVAVG